MSRFFSTTLISTSEFVPKCLPVKGTDLFALNKFIQETKNLLVLTGAGLSTESGIPDYRSEGVGLYAKTSRRPVQFQDFIKHEGSRRRYWARNFMAWPQFSSFEPNISHKILANWEKTNKINYLITQNVDRLHTKAGSQKVVELHGTTHQVICFDCGHLQSRFDLQKEIMSLNKDWMNKISETSSIAPDGDVNLTDDVVSDFQIPSCNKCGGIIKPDVVFFGESVPRKTAQTAERFIEECDSLFVVGSSLFVYSGYKLVVKCKESGKKVAILNIGQTRADNLADLKIEANCGEVLSKL